jgi:hypothetical protein
MRKTLAALAVVVLGVLASVTAAQASTTVGQTGDPTASDTYWFGGAEDLSNGYVVPAGGGVVVSLNTQSSSCNLASFGFVQGSYNLQVLRPLGGGQYTVLGDTGNQTDPCDGQLHSYPVNIPVQAGDVLGVYVVSDWVGALNGGGTIGDFIAEPAVGDTIGPLGITDSHSVDESATLNQTPTSTSDCKNGGWQNFTDDNGNPFKNQGDCVSFVATKGKNGGNG